MRRFSARPTLARATAGFTSRATPRTFTASGRVGPGTGWGSPTNGAKRGQGGTGCGWQNRRLARTSPAAGSWRAEVGAGAYRPRLLLGAPGQSPSHSIGSLRRRFRTFEWRAGSRADRLSAQLTCTHTDRCGRTEKPKLYVKRAHFRLFDASPPAVTGLGGALFGAPVQRATQTLTVKARDAGSGVRLVLMRTNRKLFDSLGSSCNVGAHQLALGLSPCPNCGAQQRLRRHPPAGLP